MAHSPTSPPAAPGVNKKKKPFIPYEVFLGVVDQLIAQAEEPHDIKVWSLGYEHSVASKLVVHDTDTADFKYQSITRQRYQRLRLVSQINQKSRRMVEKRFPRLPMMVASPCKRRRELSPVSAYVRHIDEYIPFFTSLQLGREAEQFIYNQTILLPTPAGYALLTSVERLYLPRIDYLVTRNAACISTLVRFPNLKAIVVHVGSWTRKLREGITKGLHSIDPAKLPDLALWHMTKSAVFRSIWADHLHRRRIRLYGLIDPGLGPIIELFPRRKRIRYRFCRPDTNEAIKALIEDTRVMIL
ncbi:hypothetical protein CORC01_00366 [Colletotrichum orchidophilum]|uniref:Uncharacterized protein n=1 Tax=Colletotrichum orchidophilum TaxID=1209926 RepID=A0A1G4BSW0_9PEZI|nr:uncharacterized protein CORC01_00366 [Colletotrichum orchidophilum]OHF04514.1 hypothetical protein CORC01_00366 [Colletotrichum orchidophilum]